MLKASWSGPIETLLHVILKNLKKIFSKSRKELKKATCQVKENEHVKLVNPRYALGVSTIPSTGHFLCTKYSVLAEDIMTSKAYTLISRNSQSDGCIHE